MERVLAQKANWFASRGHDIVIVTTEQKGRKPAFELAENIRCIDLAIGYEDNNGGSFADKLIHYPALQRRHHKALEALLAKENADIVISMGGNEMSFLPRIKDGSKKVLEIHFSRLKRLQYGRKGLWALADLWRNKQEKRQAGRYDRFVVLTAEDAGYWGAMPNIRVIPNSRTFTMDTPAPVGENRTVLAVGRYDYQKGYDMLLKVWCSIDTTGWQLRIAGSGDDLEKLCDCTVPGNVITGPSNDIATEYRNAAFLALSSRYEGLPMVMLEAQAAGLPCVAFECKCGPKDVLTDGEDGFLVPEGDIDTFALRMKQLMENDDLRHRMGTSAFSNSDRFDEKAIMAKWEKLFQELS